MNLAQKNSRKRFTYFFQLNQDHSQLLVVLDDTKDKTKGIEKILDREQMEEMAKKDLEKVKASEAAKKKK